MILNVLLLIFLANGDSTETTVDNDEVYEWGSSNPYNKSDTLYLRTDIGYKFVINVTELDLDSASGDYLLIKSGRSLNSEGHGKVFAYNLKGQQDLIIDNENGIIHFVMQGKNDKGKRGYKVKYQRIGYQITTTSPPEMTVTYPPLNPNETTSVLVYVGNLHYQQYFSVQIRNDLKQAISEMAIYYCKQQNILISSTPTANNTNIKRMRQCPFTWPNRDYCIEMEFEFPINTTQAFYQLTGSHLRIMWDRLSNQFLPNYNMTMYEIPDTKGSSNLWLIISCITLVLFTIFLFVLRAFIGKTYLSMKRRESDTSNINENMGNNKYSLGPDPLQSTPQLFENMYDIHEPAKIQTQRKEDYQELENDDEYDIMDINKFTPNNFRVGMDANDSTA